MKIRVIFPCVVFAALATAAVPPEVRKLAVEFGKELLHRALDATLGEKMKAWVNAARDFAPLEIGNTAFTVDMRQKTVVAIQLTSHGNSGWSRPVTPINGNYEFIAIESLDESTATKWHFGSDALDSSDTSFPITLGSTKETVGKGKETAVRFWISPETNGKRFRILFSTPPHAP